MPPRIEALVKSIYCDASHWASFGSAADLLAAAHLHRTNITHAQVERWLQAQNAYTLHRKIIRKFPRRKFLSKDLHHMWQADLVDMQAIQKENVGRRYLLMAIDVFSRQAFAKAIRMKKPEEVIIAFTFILREAGTKPKFLHTDRGTEITTQKFRNWLDGKNIIHYHTFNNEIKCSLVKRWHRTLKNLMFRYFTLHYLKYCHSW